MCVGTHPSRSRACDSLHCSPPEAAGDSLWPRLCMGQMLSMVVGYGGWRSVTRLAAVRAVACVLGLRLDLGYTSAEIRAGTLAKMTE